MHGKHENKQKNQENTLKIKDTKKKEKKSDEKIKGTHMFERKAIK